MIPLNNIRTFALSALAIISFLLLSQWQSEHVEQTPPKALKTQQESFTHDLPESTLQPVVEQDTTQKSFEVIRAKTDVLEIEISKIGGDIVACYLPEYDFNLLTHNHDKRYYILQSGLLSNQGPDSKEQRASYHSKQSAYVLSDSKNEIVIDLIAVATNGAKITKRYTLSKGSYIVKLEYFVDNVSNENYNGQFYARFKRQETEGSGSGMFGVQTFTGPAIYTPETPYKKFNIKDLTATGFQQKLNGGWAAMIEQYFVAAVIPFVEDNYEYQVNKRDNYYYTGFLRENLQVPAHQDGYASSQIYLGPQIPENLQKIHKGLDLTVDYGMLWPICKPIFWLLKYINEVVHNWGLAIILVTLIIKLMFYKLSAASYKSMGRMKQLQPKIEELKLRYAEDKAKFSQEVMNLYRSEKINPLGGCLPIVVQIPVFIALYYVLIGSVELRHAPFMLWIKDLSAKDPYYVLPIIMGITMLVQQKQSPPPADPMQAKVMLIMPVVFTALFINFPSGLVVYWIVNNLLSITQQWFITRKLAGNGN